MKAKLNTKNVLIRTETQSDYARVHELIYEAFLQDPHSDHKEQELVKSLRKEPNFIEELSIVAEIDSKFVGHILLTPIFLLSKNYTDKNIVALAPIVIDSAYQNKGIGSLLMKFAHSKVQELNYNAIVVIGHPAYYTKLAILYLNTLAFKPHLKFLMNIALVLNFIQAFVTEVSSYIQSLFFKPEFTKD